MTTTRSRKLFVNLAVRDLARSKQFFTRLGFDFDPQYENEQGTCMIVSEEAFVMLLAEPFFRTFTKRELCDTARATEGLFSISCESRDAVDQMLKEALAGGGSRATDARDHGFMYQQSFYDPDGHHWEAFWMDPAGPPAA